MVLVLVLSSSASLYGLVELASIMSLVPCHTITMYVFMLWFNSGNSLPQWCRRTLSDKAQLRMGATLDLSSFTSPGKGKGDGRPETPPSAGALDKLLSILQKRWEPKEEPPNPANEVAARVSCIQVQLNALHAARVLNVAAGLCNVNLDVAINKITAKLVESCDAS